MYIPFFIFPHNRHFFVHISPSVLEVWKFPCGRTPFQPSEDTDALLSELPPLFHNFVHAADSSQIRKDGSRRVPDQDYRKSVEELVSFEIIMKLNTKCVLHTLDHGPPTAEILAVTSW